PLGVLVAQHVVRAGDHTARAARAQAARDDLVEQVLPLQLLGSHGDRTGWSARGQISASPGSALDEDAVVDEKAAQEVACLHGLPALPALLGHELGDGLVHRLAGLAADELVPRRLLAEEAAGHEIVRGTAGELAELGQEAEQALLLLLWVIAVSGAVEPAPDRVERTDVGHG